MSCQQKTEVYARIVGYCRPVEQWNIGKKAEYFARKTYQIGIANLSPINPGNDSCDSQKKSKKTK